MVRKEIFPVLVQNVMVQVLQEHCVLDFDTVLELVEFESENFRLEDLADELDMMVMFDNEEEFVRDVAELVFGLIYILMIEEEQNEG